MKQKILVAVAINNYPGSGDLQGCINDSKGWKQRLSTKFGYSDITTIWDKNATIKEVKSVLETKFKQCQDGDSFSFIYSGHGSWMPDADGDEADGKDECICLYDEFLADDFFRKLFHNSPVGLDLVMVSDSCFSGTVTRAPVLNASVPESYSKPRFMAPPSKYLEIESQLRQGSKIFDAARAQDIMHEILITGCTDKQTSADAYIDGTYYGALSYHCFKVIDANPATISYNEFYKQLRKLLPSYEYDQIPQLEGTEENKAKSIFC